MCRKSEETQAKSQESQSPMQDGHTAQGASNAQVDAMCRNLKLGTVLGKTQACPITVAWFFGVKRAQQTAARVEQISEWISMWRNCNVDRRENPQIWEEKGPHFGWNPRRWNRLRDLFCHQLLGVGSRRVEQTGFLAVTGWQRHSGRRLVLQGATVSPVSWRCKHGQL